ncbi:hypothetical protein DIPPA_10420 [Diplonema papillatum]|nr:hypothetical protein DIPPA_10420 [Diplonema papillatum]
MSKKKERKESTEDADLACEIATKRACLEAVQDQVAALREARDSLQHSSANGARRIRDTLRTFYRQHCTAGAVPPALREAAPEAPPPAADLSHFDASSASRASSTSTLGPAMQKLDSHADEPEAPPDDWAEAISSLAAQPEPAAEAPPGMQDLGLGFLASAQSSAGLPFLEMKRRQLEALVGTHTDDAAGDLPVYGKGHAPALEVGKAVERMKAVLRDVEKTLKRKIRARVAERARTAVAAYRAVRDAAAGAPGRPRIVVKRKVIVQDPKRNKWCEGHVVHVDVRGTLTVRLDPDTADSAEGDPIAVPSTAVVVFLTSRRAASHNDEDEANLNALHEVSTAYSRFAARQAQLGDLVKKEEAAAALRTETKKGLRDMHQMKKIALQMQLAKADSQAQQAQATLDELQEEQHRMRMRVSNLKSQREMYEVKNKQLRSKTLRVKYRGRYRKLLFEMLAALGIDNVTEALGKREQGCQTDDMDPRYEIEELALLDYKEQVLVGEVANLRGAVRNLSEYNSSVEAELTCNSCRVLTPNASMLWPCGHHFCAGCCRMMAFVDTHTKLQCWKCSVCQELSLYEHVANQALSSLCARWVVKGAGHRDLATTVATFDAKLQEIDLAYAEAKLRVGEKKLLAPSLC